MSLVDVISLSKIKISKAIHNRNKESQQSKTTQKVLKYVLKLRLIPEWFNIIIIFVIH